VPHSILTSYDGTVLWIRDASEQIWWQMLAKKKCRYCISGFRWQRCRLCAANTPQDQLMNIIASSNCPIAQQERRIRQRQRLPGPSTIYCAGFGLSPGIFTGYLEPFPFCCTQMCMQSVGPGRWNVRRLGPVRTISADHGRRGFLIDSAVLWSVEVPADALQIHSLGRMLGSVPTRFVAVLPVIQLVLGRQ
jgi:hypothetical protein